MKNLLKISSYLRSSKSRKTAESPKKRTLRLEALENRELLAVTVAEIQALHPDLTIPSNANVIEIAAEKLSIDSIKAAISAAGDASQPDLIVAHTTRENNTVKFASNDNRITFAYDNITFVAYADDDANMPLILDGDGKYGTMMVLDYWYGMRDYSFNLANVTFQNGYSEKDAGALYCYLSNDAVISQCSFLNNNGGNGGAIYMTGAWNADIRNCEFIGNSSYDRGTPTLLWHSWCSQPGYGGAVNVGLCERANYFTNCLFAENYSQYTGGAAHLYMCIDGFKFTNCTITNNTAPYAGGGVSTARSDGAVCSFNNCIVAENNASIGCADICSFSPSMAEGTEYDALWTSLWGTDASYLKEIVAGRDYEGAVTGNSSISSYAGTGFTYDSSLPLFASGSYQLAANSQAYNAGSNSLAAARGLSAASKDLAGGARIKDGTIDIGAYEYGGAPTPFEPKLIVTSEDDEVDHTDDFNSDGTPNKITLREALDYYGKAFDESAYDGDYTNAYAAFSADSTTPGEYDSELRLVSGAYDTVYFSTDVATCKLESQILVESDLTIVGGKTDGTNVTIDGQNAVAAFRVNTGLLNLSDVTIQNCVGLSSGSSNKSGGGALFVKASGSAVLNGVTISNCSATYGGAIYNLGVVTIVGGAFESNSAEFGGAYYGKGTLASPELGLTSTTFSGNVASVSGGAIYNTNSGTQIGTVDLSRADFVANASSKYGGAISDFGELRLTDCSFESNTASTGGAIQAAYSDVTIAYCSFDGNKALKSSTPIVQDATYGADYGGNGGALFISNNGTTLGAGAVTLLGVNAFEGNYAENAGGAIDLTSGALNFGSSDDSSSASFIDNAAGSIGGAIVYAGNARSLAFSDADFQFDGNTSDGFAPTVAAANLTDEQVEELIAAFNIEENELETFRRYTTVTENDDVISLEALQKILGLNDDTLYVAESESGNFAPVTKSSPLEIPAASRDLCVKRALNSDVVFKLHITVEQNNSILTNVRDSSNDDRLNEQTIALSLRSYASTAVASWSINWGDGTSTTIDQLSYDVNAWHMYSDKSSHTVSLTIEYAGGGSATFDDIAFFGSSER